MTGYAVATSESAAGTLTIEIKSVNSRFLDLQFRINDDLRALEPDLRAAIMAAITRGKVELRLSFGRKAATTGSQALNLPLLTELQRLQGEVGQHFPAAQAMTMAELLRWPGVIEEGQIGQVAYASAKAGVIGMTLNVARDLSAEGIRCNTILPGIFDTPLLARAKPQVKAALSAMVPFPKRLGMAEEYAALAVEMLRNGYFNGEDVRLDGAIRMQPK